ncbi:MAG: hypothetical protein HYZ75_18215 [Elusimicrobia bacterium]|nr:hypothetical protein [Elusimicrobiota bacterium]
MIILRHVGLAALLGVGGAWAQNYSDDPDEEPAAETPTAHGQRTRELYGSDAGQPVFLSLADSLHDFGRFADGGSDSNWYVGFDNAWVVKLPPIPEGRWSRVFVGAKLGRAKTVPRRDKPWEHRILPGKVYIGVSQRPAFSSDQSFFLADTSDIPVEPHESLYLPGAGKSEWFWAEVPKSLVSGERPNYLIVWSPTREFRSADNAPILAAADSSPAGGEPRAWNNHQIQGVPPRQEEGALAVPLTLKPAMAIKLVPSVTTRVSLSAFSAEPVADRVLARFSAEGRDVELAWVESSEDQLEWNRISTYRRSPPYLFSLSLEAVSGRGSYLRARARDLWGAEGSSAALWVPGPEER